MRRNDIQTTKTKGGDKNRTVNVVIVVLVALMLTVALGAVALANPYESIPPRKANKMLRKDPSIVILDVRTEAEFQAGHIPGAQWIPLVYDVSDFF